jgi:mannosyltransferase OCH1-like enzyme
MNILIINLGVNVLHQIVKNLEEMFVENVIIFYVNFNKILPVASTNAVEIINLPNSINNVIEFIKNKKINIIISFNFINDIPYNCKLITQIKHENTYQLDDLYNIIVNTNMLPIKKYNSIIPLNIYQTWHTKKLPKDMNDCVELLKTQNPEFNHYLYDDNQCIQFITDNFDTDVINAYDTLVPGAYKADLWRYCVLYINGGIYLDIKYKGVNGFKLIELTEKEHFVRDRPENTVYNALLVVLPKNEIMLKCIQQIVDNVKNKFYGKCPLEPTGPKLIGKYFLHSEIINMELYFKSSNIDKIMYNKMEILNSYNNYRKEHNDNKKVDHYGKLWKNNNIYTQK